MNADVIEPIWVSIAALGQWDQLPDFSSRLELSLEPVEDLWREDLIQQGWDTDVFEKVLLKKLRTLDQVIFGELSFLPYFDDENGHFPSRQSRWAKVAAKALKQLSMRGAQALYFDGAAKAYTPEMFEQLDVNDHATLFHLFIEIWRESKWVATEGMNVFGLPDVYVVGFEPQSPAAQATAFSLAAQMVCDDLKLKDINTFRASESFPWCDVEWVSDRAKILNFIQQISDESTLSLDEEESVYPCGITILRPHTT